MKVAHAGESTKYAGISMDLDNQWSYMKTHGDTGWEDYPTYFDRLIPYALEVLKKEKLKITFFIVGQDAALEQNREYLSLLTKNGHEVGNHSYSHEPWLHLYTEERVRKELLDAAEQIQRATDQQPVGFRGPGFSWSPALIRVLEKSGYRYDASLLPTFIGPLARTYYFWKSDLSKEEKEQRKELFGSFGEGFKPACCFMWEIEGSKKLLEIPVTTIPLVKIPFHLSYLIYLSRFSKAAMSAYLKTALFLCRMTGTGPSFLLHPLDLLGGDQVPKLKFFPGMDMSGSEKLSLFEKVIHELKKHFTPVTMNELARTLHAGDHIRCRQLPRDS
jgi:hypothetical protein